MYDSIYKTTNTLQTASYLNLKNGVLRYKVSIRSFKDALVEPCSIDLIFSMRWMRLVNRDAPERFGRKELGGSG